MSPTARVASRLTQDPIISKSQNESLARMVRNVRERRFEAGETIYEAGAEARFMYLVVGGEVELVSPLGKRVGTNAARFGEEAATDVPHYLSLARALSEVTAIAIPRTSLIGLNQFNPGLKAQFYFSLIANFGGERVHEAAEKAKPQDSGARDGFEAAGWFVCILLPLLVLLYGPNLGLDRETTVFLAIFTATIVMWVFELVDEYVPGIFVLLTTLSLGIAPSRVVLSGFASDGFFMAMSIFGLGAMVVMSGLSFRFLLWLLRYLPNNKAGHDLGLLLTGFMLTPILPSLNGRIAIVTPFLIDMVETVKFQFGGKGATRMAVAAFTGATLISAAFITSRSVNFVIFGLLPPQEQQQFQWGYWVAASLATVVAMLVIYYAVALLVYRSPEKPQLTSDQIEVQMQLLGGIKNREWAAIASILVFALGVVTTSVHNIQPPWLGMAVLYALLLLGFLRKHEFRDRIDWPALVYLGTLVGMIAVFNYLGLDKWLGGHLAGIGQLLEHNFAGFVAVLSLAIIAIRFVIPNTATIAICATIFMPLAAQAGVNPWVVGFILLLLGDVWFFPYQCSHYVQFRELTRDKSVYDEGSFLRFNCFMNFLRIGAIYASMPFWTAMGIL